MTAPHERPSKAILVIGEDGSVGLHHLKERSGMAESGYEQRPWLKREGELVGDPDLWAKQALSWAKDQHYGTAVSRGFSTSPNGDYWVDLDDFA